MAGLDCSLPVSLNDPAAGDRYIGALHGGFVSFPSGDVRDDPTSELAASSTRITTVSKPVLHGVWPGTVFDWPAGRWVPANSPQVLSPDGSAYVYSEDTLDTPGPIATTTLRVVTVSSGNDRRLYSKGQTDTPIAWTKDGIYVVQAYYEVTSTGLRLLDPATGAERVITTSGTWGIISNGAAWGTNPNVSLISGYSPRTVNRLDLATGKITTWYTAPDGYFVQVLAVDLAGRPIIAVQSLQGIGAPPVPSYEVFRLEGPALARPLFTAHAWLGYTASWQVDSHGLWFVSFDINGEVWLYADGIGLHKVAETGKFILFVEGPCR